MEQQKKKRKFGKMEALILIPNLVLIGVVLLYLAATRLEESKVEPLVDVDPVTQKRIADLEKELLRNPSNVTKALELSRLYSEAGEFPWSYNALKNAEKNGGDDPGWKLRLGLAFLELGKNDDGVRVIEAARRRCGSVKCAPPLRVKLDLFAKIARTLKKKQIDTRVDRRAAEKALQDVFKPVQVDPNKMRPKAPVETPAEPPAQKPAEAAPPAKG